MSFLKNFITGLLLLTVFLGSGAAEAKITSGSHGLADKIKTTSGNTTFHLRQFEYDSRNRVLCETQRMNSARFSSLSEFINHYDAENQLERTEVPGESDIYYFYDGLGRPTEINRGANNWTEYAYDNRGYLNRSETNGAAVIYVNDAAGRVTSITYPQGQKVTYGYDDTNAVTTVKVEQGATMLLVADYQYDDMGRVTDVYWGDGGATHYRYDAIGRLSTHTLDTLNETTLNYNPANQIVVRSVSDSAKQTALLYDTPATYTPNDLNQYAEVDEIPLGYDLNGNLTAFDGWSYGYDALNRLESAAEAGTGTGTSLTLSYDPTGRLSRSTLNNAATDYVYSGDKLIGEYQAGSLVKLYVYPPHSDIPIARLGATAPLSDLEYLHADERGSIVAVTDDTGPVESHQYDVYGVPLDQIDSLFRYTGQIQLRGTDLYHYKARAYHPGLGRFLQTDPIGYDDGMNLYAYVGNDPVNLVDPTGQVGKAFRLLWKVVKNKGDFRKAGKETISEVAEAGVELLDGDLTIDDAIAVFDLLSPVSAKEVKSAAKFARKNIPVSRAKYGEAADHISDAQRAGHPDVLTIARPGAPANRNASIGGLPKVPGKQLDEYPPAMFKEGGAGASVRPINPRDNMAAGACIGNACRGLPNGARVRIKVVD